MVLLDKITIKTSQIFTFFRYYGKLPIFMFSEERKKYSLSQKNTQTIYQKWVTFCNIWSAISHRNNCFLFLEYFSRIYQAHYVRS